MTDDAILCDVLDEEGSETKDDTDNVSNEPICPQSSDVRQALDVLREYMLFSDNGEFKMNYQQSLGKLIYEASFSRNRENRELAE